MHYATILIAFAATACHASFPASPIVGHGKRCGGGYPGAPTCRRPLTCLIPRASAGMTGVSGRCAYPEEREPRRVSQEWGLCGPTDPYPECTSGLMCDYSKEWTKLSEEGLDPEVTGICVTPERVKGQ